jgi:hypothetical protein
MVDAVNVNTNTYFKIYWNATATMLHAAIVCQNISANQWCAVGISTTGGMLGSDAAIGTGVGAGFQMVDFQLSAQTQPSAASCPSVGGVCADTTNPRSTSCQNNVIARRGSFSGGYYTFEFSRPLSASDTCDVGIVLDVPSFVIFAVGPTSVGADPYPNNILKHTTKSAGGSTRITFTTRPPPVTTGTTGQATTGSTGSISGTTQAPSTTGAVSTTTTTTTATATSSSSTTEGVTTSSDTCPGLEDSCKKICGTQDIVRCLCQRGAPSAECGAASSLVASVALVVAILAFFM